MKDFMDNPQMKYLAEIIDAILIGNDLKEQDWNLLKTTEVERRRLASLECWPVADEGNGIIYAHCVCRSDEVLDERGGGTDKIAVPEFSGEDDRDGCKAKSYLRKVQEIDLAALDSPDGVDVFMQWITEHYLDKEIVKAGKYMSDFFKHYKRGHAQDIRDFNMEFDRHISKLKEVGCVLPSVCCAWWYIDKLRMDNAAELNLLSSVGNQYELIRLQEAAVVQDRMNRRIWEQRKVDTKKNQVYVAEIEDTPDDEEDPEDLELYDLEETTEVDDDETHEAYVAFQNAKAKYSSMLKARGTISPQSREESLQKAKARSYCSACGKKGHWHKDPICPKNKQASTTAPHTTHIAYYTNGQMADLEVIVDCACSRTLAGPEWVKAYMKKADQCGVPYFVMRQNETFKFGGPKVYPSTRAMVCFLCLQGKWFAVKVAIVATHVPLLLSRPVLAALGMQFKLETNEANFTSLDLEDVALSFTASGHACAEAVSFSGQPPAWPDLVDWSVTEIHIPVRSERREAYMASAASEGIGMLFYPKVKFQTFCCKDWEPAENRLAYHVMQNAIILWSNILGEKIMDHELNFFGLAAAVFNGKLKPPHAPCLLRHPMSTRATTPSLWKMKREELVTALEKLGISVRAEWTVPELRATLIEHQETQGTPNPKVKGLTRLTVDELKDKCAAEGIAMPDSKLTRGLLMKLLRENAPPTGDEVVCFGMYKGYLYKEVNEKYLEWAMEEVAANPQHSLDLARLARWAQARSTMPGTGSRPSAPEVGAVVPLPKAAYPVPKVNMPMKEETSSKQSRTSRTRPLKMEESSEFSEVEWATEDRIKDMEARLAILRQIKAYWQKVDELREMRRSMRHEALWVATNDSAEEDLPEKDIVELYDPDTIEADEYDIDNDGLPKVNLNYPSDYDVVRNLPAKRMKRASRKRVTGWAQRALTCLCTTLVALASPVAEELKEVVVEPLHDAYLAVSGHRPQEETVSLLELFAGSAHLTGYFAAKGYNVLEPRDIVYGHDLFDRRQQVSVLEDIQRMKPRLLWVALPCTKWSPWQRLNYAHRRQQLRREQAKQRKLMKFTLDCAWEQLDAGREVAFEHPRDSGMWEDSALEPLINSPLMSQATFDMCRYNLRAVTDGGRLRKPTRVVASNRLLLDGLRLTCGGGHEHTATQGRNTRPAGVYTKEFCRAIFKGYEKMTHSLWYHREEQTWEAMPVGTTSSTSSASRSPPAPHQSHVRDAQVPPRSEDQRRADHQPDSDQQPGAALPGKEGAAGIHLPSSVPNHIAKALKRIHQNLGHPSNADLSRHLRLAGAGDLAVKAAQAIKCETCSRLTGPGTRRPGRVVRPLDFNQEVCVDTIALYDVDGGKIDAISILDVATGYHLVCRIRGRKSADLLQDFMDHWVQWAGPPLQVTCDEERGLMKEFTDGLDMLGIRSRYTAGQAHWQNGAVVDYALAMTCAAKNNLRRHHGYSPAQWLFGSEPRTGDAMLDENEKLFQLEELRTEDDLWRRKQQIRYAARIAFLESQADAATKRALLGRSRVYPGPFSVGDYVYVFRVNKTAGGKARQRQNVGEHLRPAESEELGQAFQTQALKDDLMRVVQNLKDEDNDEVFADATDPPPLNKRAVETQLVPERRVTTKGTVRMLKRPVPQPSDDQPGRISPAQQNAQDLEAIPERDVEDALDDAVNQAFVVERRAPRSTIKQLDKEVKWEEIPEGEKYLYLEAEKKQWDEHLRYEAVRVHPPEDAGLLRAKVPANRILKARFAYRDKNVAKRREDPTIPAKAKARLCIGGHMDPDLQKGEINTEAPTASKTSMFTLLFLAAQFGWRLAAGDVEAAFLNGIESKRNLYFEPPKRGLPGVEPGSLVEIVKGVFGLSNSPRLWWDKLAGELKNLDIIVNGIPLRLAHHDFDPCLFLLQERDDPNKLRGALITHVDDLLIAAPPGEIQQLMKGLSAIFPIAEWEQGNFEYTGSTITQYDDVIEVHQKSYINFRLETVEFPAAYNLDDPADEVTKQDNMSTVGALSWLASQSRPDLQAGVSLAQRKQKSPTYGDVKETNRVVKMAQAGKDEPLRFTRLTDDPIASCCFWCITTQPGPTCNLTPSLNLMKQMMHKDKGSIPNLAT
ncbi:unnamed protein product [Cladocopium goreaui]|uniref:Integrase catalytic domain-containing protein n=1 Tax=Cladocopium goreaui TaxID=2562237 RepID=A0A9P1FJE2_9DINO|nr:unnamed protein product [Cladocopium goreaui]